ncbi:tyrosyl-DNA phosphodiesterase 2 isoform X2 [Hypomesus transpacificus]|nr:tyrosyl-DNA phosphodiesterase 2 isoform X2 [Hypomesus transpacificus]XP_046896007.1 tyrosyl-DNA phosphodiesterase 2 isoform X2 [Hypomesus transpacificus]
MGDCLKQTSRRKKKRGKKEGNGENRDNKEGETNESASASTDPVQHRNSKEIQAGKSTAKELHPNQDNIKLQRHEFTSLTSLNSPLTSTKKPKQEQVLSRQSPLLQSSPDQPDWSPLPQSSPNQSDQSPSDAVHEEVPKKKADPNKLSLLTWNIDGLDLENIKERFYNLIDHLIEYHPDVVLLQEVVPPLVKALKEVLKPYHVLPGDDRGYFTAILLRKSRLQLLDSSIVKYPNTKMQRNLLMAHVSFFGRPLCLMTSHMESMKDNSKERVSQLRQVWRSMDEQPSDLTVIFGGDTNLRDREVSELGGLPWGIRDVWESLGSPKDCSFTWDLLTNNNKELPFPARLRFDRLFLRQAVKGWRATAEDMVLVGMERLECSRFISDHWGILCTFTMNPPSPPTAEQR